MMFSHESRSADQARKEEMLQGRGPEDGTSRDGSRGESSAGKRKYADREPESPGQIDPEVETAPLSKKERSYFGDMDTDSPSSYPKHVLVPASERQHESKQYMPQPLDQMTFPPEHSEQGAVLTPDSVGRGRPAPSYEPQPYPPRQHHQYHDVYRTPSYTPDMEYGRSYGHPSRHYQAGPPPASSESFSRPRRWACDYCNVATFLSYEEACAHEDVCARRHQESHYQEAYQRPRPPTAAYGGHGPMQQQESGLGALYYASQEVVTPPTPYYQQPPNRWGAHHAPPLPVLPHEQAYYRQGYYDTREEYSQEAHYQYGPPGPYHHPHHTPHDYYQKRLLLALPSDRDSLSDRQCYVRSEMVEIFAASQKDVAARHSKGAQKLVTGQVGIRCVHCSHLRPRDRAERSVCYPKSICRIYQTVADMQRFHFENCREIPDHVRQLYKKLKTTRPRGVGSPQSYWVSSAKTLGLADTSDGIRFANDLEKDRQEQPLQQQEDSKDQQDQQVEAQPERQASDLLMENTTI